MCDRQECWLIEKFFDFWQFLHIWVCNIFNIRCIICTANKGLWWFNLNSKLTHFPNGPWPIGSLNLGWCLMLPTPIGSTHCGECLILSARFIKNSIKPILKIIGFSDNEVFWLNYQTKVDHTLWRWCLIELGWLW